MFFFLFLRNPIYTEFIFLSEREQNKLSYQIFNLIWIIKIFLLKIGSISGGLAFVFIDKIKLNVFIRIIELSSFWLGWVFCWHGLFLKSTVLVDLEILVSSHIRSDFRGAVVSRLLEAFIFVGNRSCSSFKDAVIWRFDHHHYEEKC